MDSSRASGSIRGSSALALPQLLEDGSTKGHPFAGPANPAEAPPARQAAPACTAHGDPGASGQDQAPIRSRSDPDCFAIHSSVRPSRFHTGEPALARPRSENSGPIAGTPKAPNRQARVLAGGRPLSQDSVVPVPLLLPPLRLLPPSTTFDTTGSRLRDPEHPSLQSLWSTPGEPSAPSARGPGTRTPGGPDAARKHTRSARIPDSRSSPVASPSPASIRSTGSSGTSATADHEPRRVGGLRDGRRRSARGVVAARHRHRGEQVLPQGRRARRPTGPRDQASVRQVVHRARPHLASGGRAAAATSPSPRTPTRSRPSWPTCWCTRSAPSIRRCGSTAACTTSTGSAARAATSPGTPATATIAVDRPTPTRRPQVSACFIQSVDDDLMSIFELVKQRGAGLQVRLRHRHQFLEAARAHGEALGRRHLVGLMSFLEVLDRAPAPPSRAAPRAAPPRWWCSTWTTPRS